MFVVAQCHEADLEVLGGDDNYFDAASDHHGTTDNRSANHDSRPTHDAPTAAEHHPSPRLLAYFSRRQLLPSR